MSCSYWTEPKPSIIITPLRQGWASLGWYVCWFSDLDRLPDKWLRLKARISQVDRQVQEQTMPLCRSAIRNVSGLRKAEVSKDKVMMRRSWKQLLNVPNTSEVEGDVAPNGGTASEQS